MQTYINYRPLLSRLLLGLSGCFMALNSYAQSSQPTREVQHSIEWRGGYTGGRYVHYTDDYTPTINLFGGGSSQTGQLVEHHFKGALLGASYLHEISRPGSLRRLTLLAGLDMLAASDQLTFADGQRATLTLVAVHPHVGVESKKAGWLLRGEAGLLLGRTGYFASTSTWDILSSRTVVDTVHVVPTISLRIGWASWLVAESGYGSAGLLGLANPTWHSGVGTGFGRRSPVTLLAGITGAESTDYDDHAADRYFLQLEAAPATKCWRVNGFFTFGAGTYSRIAAQAAYRLPLCPAKR